MLFRGFFCATVVLLLYLVLYCCSIAIGGTPCFSEDTVSIVTPLCKCVCVCCVCVHACVPVESCDWSGGLWAGRLSLWKRLSQTQSSRSPHRSRETTLFLTDLSTSPILHPFLSRAKLLPFSDWHTALGLRPYLLHHHPSQRKKTGSPLTLTLPGRHGNGYLHSLHWGVSTVRGAGKVSMALEVLHIPSLAPEHCVRHQFQLE